MNETTSTENNSVELEKPVQVPLEDNIKFPPFPEPRSADFDDDITEEERNHYKVKFKDLNKVTTHRIHCTACDRHLGCSARSENRICPHPLLRTLMCHTCHTFYNSGEFEKGDDGSELYCRWCGQGGQVYCCSECPHVFCSKCIKRNMGAPMIKEIEETEDWKCFRCNSKYLWDLRALCWAVLRYCDLKNRITFATQDPILKEAYQKDCALDLSTCCRIKNRRKNEEKKPKPKEETKKNPPPTITKAPSTIQVKKFASINLEDSIIKIEKKPQKRPASPKPKPIIIKSPLSSTTKILTPVIMPPMAKKMRMTNPSMLTPVRFSNDRKPTNSYSRIRPHPPIQQIVFNGYTNNTTFNNMLVSDNINLSLESLTQGLDMATVAGMTNNGQDNDVVCTPDFPLEPLCEVTEDTNDDDVECIGPVETSKATSGPPPPPPLIPRNINQLANISSENIIQMTENDVTVNAVTGGLKFRVDPQTLSANKMYRLPDGRIFAINANPNMPGGYSATIVAVTDDAITKMPPKGATYAAKLSTVRNQMLTPPPLKEFRNQNSSKNKTKRSTPKTTKSNKRTDTPSRDCDMNVPVEWFRYNVIDAVDALEYSLSRLNKLKQEATTLFLRSRSVAEMRTLHKRLERLLNTSTCRFNEIRENINKELKLYLMKKIGGNVSEDDDDVEILPDDHDDPIFIDENSVESNVNESQEVDLTVLGSSDHNDSSEKSLDKNDGVQILEPICDVGHQDSNNDDHSIAPDKTGNDKHSETLDSSVQEECLLTDERKSTRGKRRVSRKQSLAPNNCNSITCDDNDSANTKTEKEKTTDNSTNIVTKDSEIGASDVNGEEVDGIISTNGKHQNTTENSQVEDTLKDDSAGQHHNDKKMDDSEMSEEIIENLLKDESADNVDKGDSETMDVPA